ncbi:hypothetical protein [Dactylosporangium sp. CA-092794]|uniref:hypothetical protein n=1 Tax=Dactylosporangium sp. CA-092794 TaxID=3239929 RepID=UPI003D92D0A7
MTAPTRRTLTGAQMTTIQHAIQAVDEPATLLATVLAHVYDALLQQEGRRLADLRGSGRIHPEDWQIPVTQWDAIADAASRRAEVWGTDAQARADLLDRMPGVFDDPEAPTDTPPAGPPGTALRLLCVSVHSDTACYLVGNRTCTRSRRCRPGSAPASPTSTRSKPTCAPSCAAWAATGRSASSTTPAPL